MKYEGTRTTGVYKYPDVVTYNIIVKNYGDTDLHYVKVTDTISEELKNSVDVNTIKFDLQKGYYVTTDTGEQVFVSVDGDTSNTGTTTNNTTTNNTTGSTASGTAPAYSAGALTKSLTIDTIKAGKSINLKLTMTARQDIKRALNLKNSVNVTASTIETPETDDTTTEGTTEGKDNTTTENTSDTTEEEGSDPTDITKGALTKVTSVEDNSSTEDKTDTKGDTSTSGSTTENKTDTKGGTSNKGNTTGTTTKIVALPVDEVMHNDTEIISMG